MESIMRIADQYELRVYEDAAQALGAKFDGKFAGTFDRGGCISFYPAKILGCFGDGGAILCNDATQAEKLRLLRDHGRDENGDIPFWGFNSRLDKLQAAILAIPMSDTLKLAEKHTIQSTINRENVWRALTPQLFSKEALKFAYNSNLENLVNLTDEASLFDNLDIEVMIIEGSSENIKITFKEDLKLVENILINQKRIKS